MKILYILSGLGVIAMLAEIFKFKKFLLPIVLVGLLGAIACAIKDWNTDIHYYNNMLTFNNYALLFTCVICGTAFLWFMMSGNFFKEESNRTDHYALILFALIGAVILVSYSNMVMLFLGIEILSIPLYVLAGSRKDDLSSNEAALKYFLMGAVASGFLLFGIALLYGFFGTFDLHEIQRVTGVMEEWKNGLSIIRAFQCFVLWRNYFHARWFVIQSFICAVSFLGTRCLSGSAYASHRVYGKHCEDCSVCSVLTFVHDVFCRSRKCLGKYYLDYVRTHNSHRKHYCCLSK